MPKYSAKRKKIEAKKLSKTFLKHRTGAAIARVRGTTRQTENEKLRKNELAQEILITQIQKQAQKAGINLTWHLKKLKEGADNAEKIIGYIHQYKQKKKKGSKIEKIKPDEVVSNEFITTKDWSTQRQYLHDIAEIMRWIKQNGLEQKVGVQVFVGSEMVTKIKEMENDQVGSAHR